MLTNASTSRCLAQVFIAAGRVGDTCKLVWNEPQSSVKRQRQAGGSSSCQACRTQRARSLSPILRRVGGGYDYIYARVPFLRDPPPSHRSLSRGRQLADGCPLSGPQQRPATAAQLVQECYRDYDTRMLADIIREADTCAADEGMAQARHIKAPDLEVQSRDHVPVIGIAAQRASVSPCRLSDAASTISHRNLFWRVMQASLAQVLRAYQRVLGERGLHASEDMHFYRLLIALSLRPEAGWWDRLAAQRAEDAKSGRPGSGQIWRARGKSSSGRPPTSRALAAGPPVEKTQRPQARPLSADAGVNCRRLVMEAQAIRRADNERPGRRRGEMGDTEALQGYREACGEGAGAESVQPRHVSEGPGEESGADSWQHVADEFLERSRVARAARQPQPSGIDQQEGAASDSVQRPGRTPARQAISRAVTALQQRQTLAAAQQPALAEPVHDEAAVDTRQCRVSAESVLVRGRIHGRTYVLVAEDRLLSERRARVKTWLGGAPDTFRDHKAEESPAAGPDPLPRLAAHAAGPVLVGGRTAARHEPAGMRERRSRSSSPIRQELGQGGGRRAGGSLIRHRSASPEHGRISASGQPGAPQVSVQELRVSWAAWQRATHRLIDIGHAATQRRHWNSCRRAFQVQLRFVCFSLRAKMSKQYQIGPSFIRPRPC